MSSALSSLLLTPPSSLTPSTVLSLSQSAPNFFARQSRKITLPYPLSLLQGESQETWQIYENLLLVCLRTGDHERAYLCLKELTDRFGKTNERVMGLTGLYREATAHNSEELDEVMRQYEEMLKTDPTNTTIRKRRIALFRSTGRTSDAITALIALVDSSPIDAEAWSELTDLYLIQGSYAQATYCLEEVLLAMPNAWNMHAKLGEVTYLAANAMESGGDQLKSLSESMRRFCRSIELCDDYLRGYYGLKLTTTRLLQALSNIKSPKPPQASSDPTAGDLAPPSVASVEKLNKLATSKLGEILRRSSAGEKGWDGYSEAELIAARQLLNRDSQKIER